MIISNSNIIGNYNLSGTPSYLLDTYSATAAYSLRQLKTGVEKVVRVRRSSDNREENFTATEVTDGTLTGFCGVGDGFVVTWYDQSGNSNDATQTTASRQAKIVTSGVLETSTNGQAAVLADGTNDGYKLGSNYTTTSAFTALHVFDRASSGINSRIFGAGYGTFMWNPTNEHRTRWTTNTLHDSSQTQTGSFLLSTYRTTGNSVGIRTNGTAGTSQVYAHTAQTITSAQIPLLQASGAYHNGYFQEFILMESDESSNIGSIESDINTYYSIY